MRAAKVAAQLNEDLAKIFDPSDKRIPSSDYFFLCCFCGPEVLPANEILMWSHYSASHQGFRFFIDLEGLTQEANLTKVKYSQHRIILDPTGFITKREEAIQKAYIESMGLKSIAWEYEQEYRWFVDKNFCKFDKAEKATFINFDLNRIKRIDFGIRCPLDVIEDMKKRIKELGLNIQLKRAIRDKSDFKLNYENIL